MATVASSSSNTTVVSANDMRRALLLYNTDANDCYVKFGTTASITDFTVKIPSGGYFEAPQPIYRGQVDAIWSADGAGSLQVTEIT